MRLQADGDKITKVNMGLAEQEVCSSFLNSSVL
jgi:hypothetical protein